MSTFFKRVFRSDKGEADLEKQALEAELSFIASKFDEQLARLLFADFMGNINREAYLEFQKQMSVLQVDTLWSVVKEVALLNDYIALYQAALPNKLHVKCINKVETDKSIPALILFPLLHNALNMGYNSLADSPLKVTVNALNSTLTMEVSNRVNHHIHSQEETVCIDRFKQRLQSTYPSEQYELFFNSNSRTFKAYLQIKL